MTSAGMRTKTKAATFQDGMMKTTRLQKLKGAKGLKALATTQTGEKKAKTLRLASGLQALTKLDRGVRPPSALAPSAIPKK